MKFFADYLVNYLKGRVADPIRDKIRNAKKGEEVRTDFVFKGVRAFTRRFSVAFVVRLDDLSAAEKAAQPPATPPATPPA